jgi:hypothetical protein
MGVVGMKVPFKNIFGRITGVSTPWFGVSWTPPKSEQVVAQRVVTFLEDRRVVSIHATNLPPPSESQIRLSRYTRESIQEIRGYLSTELHELDRESDLHKLLRTMRSCCTECLHKIDLAEELRQADHLSGRNLVHVVDTISEFKTQMTMLIANLAMQYQIDIDDVLLPMFPASDDKLT